MSLLDVKHSGPSVGHLDSRYVNVTGDTSTGPQIINTNSTAALVVEQDGVVDNVLVVDTTNGRVGVNTIPTIASLDIAGNSISITRSSNDVFAPTFLGRKNVNGAAVFNGVYTFQLSGYGYNGSSYLQNALIAMIADGSFSGSSAPGRIEFHTTKSGSTSPTTKFIIKHDGKTTVGSTSGSGQFNVIGSSDVIQTIIKAHSTQTTNLQEWQNSSGTVLASIGGTGFWAIGNSSVPVTSTRFLIAENIGTASDTTTRNGLQVNYLRTATRTSGTDYGLNILISNRSTNGGTATGGSYQIENRAVALTTASAFKALVYGRTTDVGTIVDAHAIQTDMVANANTFTNSYGIKINAPTITTGAITNNYGLYINNHSVGTTLNYAIYTNAGLVHFGDTVDLASGKNLTLLAGNITTDTTTGTKIGTATTQKLGFWNVTPVVQQVTNAYTSDGEGSAYTGIDNAQAGTVYATVADLNQLRVAYETLRASYDDLLTKLKTTGIVA